MRIYTSQGQGGKKRQLLPDANEAIVELHTSFAHSHAAKARYSRTPKELPYFCQYLRTCHYGHLATLNELLSTVGPATLEDWLIQQRTDSIRGSTLCFSGRVLKLFIDGPITQGNRSNPTACRQCR